MVWGALAAGAGSLLGSGLASLFSDDPEMQYADPKVLAQILAQYGGSPYDAQFVPGPAGAPGAISGAFAQREALRAQQQRALQQQALIASGQLSPATERGREGVSRLRGGMMAQAASTPGRYNPALARYAQNQGAIAAGRADPGIQAAAQMERMQAARGLAQALGQQRGMDAGAYQAMLARDAYERNRALQAEALRGKAAKLSLGMQQVPASAAAAREAQNVRYRAQAGG